MPNNGKPWKGKWRILVWKSKEPGFPWTLISDVRRLLKNLMFNPNKWQPTPISTSEKSYHPKVDYSQIGFFIHVHYPEYVAYVSKLFQFYGHASTFYVTTTRQDIHDNVRSMAELAGTNVDIRLVPNRGRNFGPLFTEFGNDLAKHEFSIHLHSKKSPHFGSERAFTWAMANWKLLGLDKKLFDELLENLNALPNAGLAFAIDLGVTKPSSFGWGMNNLRGNQFLRDLGLPTFPNKPFLFPAGGMFIFRPKALNQLLKMKFDYQMFPIENGAYDATPQHALERVVGLLPWFNKFQLLIFDARSNTFSFDQSFIRRD